MDPLSWLLVMWLAVAAFIFVIMQKVIEIWPPPTNVMHHHQNINLQKNASNVPAQRQTNSENSGVSLGQKITQWTNQIRDNLTESAVKLNSNNAHVTVSPPGVQNAPPQQSSSKNESVEWLNEFLHWFFYYYRGKVTFLDSWCRAMNEAAKKLVQTTGYDLIFEEVKAVENKTVPCVSELRTEKGPRESLTIRCHIQVSAINFKFVSSQRLLDKLVVSNHSARLYNLDGQVQTRLVCMGSELFAMMCFDGQPNVNMEITQTNVEPLAKADHIAIEQVIRKCLSSAIVNMSFLDRQNVPNAMKNLKPRDGHLPTSVEQDGTKTIDDLLRRLSIPPPTQISSSLQNAFQMEQYNRLLVKILRAESLEELKSYTQPFVIVELDEPSQKHTTTLSQGTSPVWDEHFLFDIDQKRSQELLFEIYGKSSEYFDPRDVSAVQQKFLGLAIISVDEIRKSTITHHSLLLQPRPFIKDKVKGTLYVECLFVYTSKQDHDEDFLFQELEMHMKQHGGHITTAIANRDNEMLVLKIPELGVMKSSDEMPNSSSSNNFTGSGRSNLSTKAASASASPNRSSRARTPETLTLDERGRRKKRATFFTNLKQKLSFRSKTPIRAQSLDPAADHAISPTDFTYHPPPRSTSSPARREELAHSHHLELGPGASDSELSGGSIEALHEPSYLVVEVLQNNLKKYYHVPGSMLKNARAKQLIKSGKKLHILNDHTFVAVKLPSSTSCKVCLKAITTTFRRQGYQCRDCRIMCHKRCYMKATGFRCINSKVSLLNITNFTDTVK